MERVDITSICLSLIIKYRIEANQYRFNSLNYFTNVCWAYILILLQHSISLHLSCYSTPYLYTLFKFSQPFRRSTVRTRWRQRFQPLTQGTEYIARLLRICNHAIHNWIIQIKIRNTHYNCIHILLRSSKRYIDTIYR